MAATLSVITSQYGNFTIVDNDTIFDVSTVITDAPAEAKELIGKLNTINNHSNSIGTVISWGPDNYYGVFNYPSFRPAPATELPPTDPDEMWKDDVNTAEDEAPSTFRTTAMINAVNAINAKIKDMTDTTRRTIQTEQRIIQADQRDDVRVLKVRGENDYLGIYQNHVCVTCDDRRALLMTAMKSMTSGLMPELRPGEEPFYDALMKERANPTPPPDLFGHDPGANPTPVVISNNGEITVGGAPYPSPDNSANFDDNYSDDFPNKP